MAQRLTDTYGGLVEDKLGNLISIPGEKGISLSELRDFDPQFVEALEADPTAAQMMASGGTLSEIALQSYVPGALFDQWTHAKRDFRLDVLAPIHSDPKRHGKWLRADDSAARVLNCKIAPGAAPVEVETKMIPGATFKVAPTSTVAYVTMEDMQNAQTEFGIDVLKYKLDVQMAVHQNQRGVDTYRVFRSLDATDTYSAKLGYYRDYTKQVLDKSGEKWSTTTTNVYSQLITVKQTLLEVGSALSDEELTIVCNPLAAMYLRENPIWRQDYSLTVDQHGLVIQDKQQARRFNFLIVDAKIKNSAGVFQYAWGPDAWVGYLGAGGPTGLTPVRTAVTGPDRPVGQVFPDPNLAIKTDHVAVRGPEYDVFEITGAGMDSGVLLQNVYAV